MSSAALLKSPGRSRVAAAGHSVGIILYLVSVGLVATAIIGVFFGTGFFLLVQSTGVANSGSGTRDPRAEVRPFVYSLLPPYYSDHRPTDGKLGLVAAKTENPVSAEVVASSAAALTPHPVAPEAAPPQRHDAVRISATVTPVGEAPTSPIRDLSSSAEVPTPSSTANPTSTAPGHSAVQPEPAPTSRPAPAAASPISLLSAVEISELLGQGDARLRIGDITSARLLYERAAVAGDGRAALRLGATFDPTFLGRAGLRNVRGDPAEARLWYSRALELRAAEHHLESLETRQGR